MKSNCVRLIAISLLWWQFQAMPAGNLYGQSAIQSADVSSPDVYVLAPDKRLGPVDSDSFTVRVVVVSRSSPLTEVTISLNGKVVERRKLSGALEHRLSLEAKVNLQPGANSLVVVAANKQAASTPELRKIIYHPRTTPATLKPNLAFLAIGISNYSSTSDLAYARADAVALAEAISAQAGASGPFENVRTKLLLDEQATREGILKALDWLNAQAQSDEDVRVLFLCGKSDAGYFGEPFFFILRTSAKSRSRTLRCEIQVVLGQVGERFWQSRGVR